MRIVFKVLSGLIVVIYVMKFIHIASDRDAMLLSYWKLIINISTYLSCTVLLGYYGYHISRVITNHKFNKLCHSIIALAILRSLINAFQFIYDRFIQPNSSFYASLGSVCQDPGEKEQTCTYFCYVILAWSFVVFVINEFTPMIIVLLTIQPKQKERRIDRLSS